MTRCSPATSPTPQPGGFEGFLGIEVGPNTRQLSVADDVSDGTERRIGFSTARPATLADAADCDDLIAEVPDSEYSM